MRVKKIILSNPDVFNVRPTEDLSEERALSILAQRVQKDNDLNIVGKYHLAVCQLYALGLIEDAIELSKEVLKKAEQTAQYLIAADLCHKLIKHYQLIQNRSSADNYSSLFTKMLNLASQQNESFALFCQAFDGFPIHHPQDAEIALLDNMNHSLYHTDDPWNSYCGFIFKLAATHRKHLVHELQLAADYYHRSNLSYFAAPFLYMKVLVALSSDDLKGARFEISALHVGTIFWFKANLELAKTLVAKKVLTSYDLCNSIMENPNYELLHSALKKQWKAVYKSAFQLLLDGN